MTEEECLKCTDPQPLLEFLRAKASNRKMRLFAVACCRSIWPLLTDKRSQMIVILAEKFADGAVKPDELSRQRTKFRKVMRNPMAIASAEERANSEERALQWAEGAAWEVARRDSTYRAAYRTAWDVAWAMTWRAGRTMIASDGSTVYSGKIGDGDWNKARGEQCCLLRNIFGPLPFRPITINPIWLSSTVTSLAESIYSERAFDRLPILADALEDAGCTSQEILDHCRSGGEHVRGCWALDLVLGKE